MQGVRFDPKPSQDGEKDKKRRKKEEKKCVLGVGFEQNYVHSFRGSMLLCKSHH